MTNSSQGFQTKNLDQIASELKITVSDVKKVAAHLGFSGSAFTPSQVDRIKQFVTTATTSGITIQQMISQAGTTTATATAGTPTGQNVQFQGFNPSQFDLGDASSVAMSAAQLGFLQQLQVNVEAKQRIVQIALGNLLPANQLEQQIATKFKELSVIDGALSNPFSPGMAAMATLHSMIQAADGDLTTIDLNQVLNTGTTTPALPAMVGSTDQNIKLLGAAQ